MIDCFVLFCVLYVNTSEWFSVPKSELQALAVELAVERRLRESVEQRLARAEAAQRTAERERDLYRVRTFLE